MTKLTKTAPAETISSAGSTAPDKVGLDQNSHSLTSLPSRLIAYEYYPEILAEDLARCEKEIPGFRCIRLDLEASDPRYALDIDIIFDIMDIETGISWSLYWWEIQSDQGRVKLDEASKARLSYTVLNLIASGSIGNMLHSCLGTPAKDSPIQVYLFASCIIASTQEWQERHPCIPKGEDKEAVATKEAIGAELCTLITYSRSSQHEALKATSEILDAQRIWHSTSPDYTDDSDLDGFELTRLSGDAIGKEITR